MDQRQLILEAFTKLTALPISPITQLVEQDANDLQRGEEQAGADPG